jgi:hypothetical protein
MKHCPRCGLIVDERFRFCDTCGYDWADPAPLVTFRQRRWLTFAATIGLMFGASYLCSWVVRGCYGW